MFAVLSPGLDVKPLLAELRARVAEELDYALEADAQRRFAVAYADDPEIFVPRVVASAPKVLVSEWLDGMPLAKIIAGGDRAQRDRAGYLLAVLHFSAPARAGLLHADPHPGNFRLLDDGRLGVIDFGAVRAAAGRAAGPDRAADQAGDRRRRGGGAGRPAPGGVHTAGPGDRRRPGARLPAADAGAAGA
jgi:predicted unusual protein kinase regulating ubiquinone biosynthesis (AarF/ABC1/UbiB family)